MSAYWIARAHVNIPEEYNKYATQVPPILARFGGRILARGGPFQIMEGTQEFSRFVIVEFPSLADAVACHESADYQRAAAFRAGSVGIVDLVIVEGQEAP